MHLTPTFAIAVLLALAIHEWAHAFAADRLGDPTARYEGRLTLNPIVHLDALGTIMFLIVGFGWGKAVPFDPRYFKHVKRDTAIVALAGPLSNFILAWLAFGGLLLLGEEYAKMAITGRSLGMSDPVAIALLSQLLTDFLRINLVLMAFNLLPVAPLDGSKILHMFIPLRFEENYLQYLYYGPYILLFLIVAGQLFGMRLLGHWIDLIIVPILRGMFGLL